MHIPAALHHAKTHIQLCTRSKRTLNSVPGQNGHSTLYQVKTHIQLCTRSKHTFNSVPGKNAHSTLYQVKTHTQLGTRSKRPFSSVPGQNAHSTLYQVKTHIQLCTRSKRTFNSVPGQNAHPTPKTFSVLDTTQSTVNARKPKLSIVSKSPYLHRFRLFTTLKKKKKKITSGFQSEPNKVDCLLAVVVVV